MKYSGIGGQAVIEGIMMMKGEDYAVAVRRPDKEIEVKKDTYQSITKKAKILQLPFVRGVFRFADSMIIGMRSLSYSASFFEDDEDAEPGKFEQLLDRVFGEKLESAIMAAVLVISFTAAAELSEEAETRAFLPTVIRMSEEPLKYTAVSAITCAISKQTNAR